MENCCHPFADCHVQPSCPESERAVLGAMLLDAGTRRQLRNSLRAEDFYDTEHQRIFQHLCVLADPIDLVALKANPLFGLSAGYFDELIAQASLPDDVAQHARRLHKRYVLRQLLEAQAELALDLQAG